MMRNCLLLILFFIFLSYNNYANIVPQNKIPLEENFHLDTTTIQRLIDKGFHSCADDYSKALYYLDKAEKISKQINYPKGIGDCNYIKSWVYYYRNDYQISLEYLNKAKTIYQEINSDDGMAKYYFGLGRLEHLYGNYVNAIKSYQKAIKYNEKHNNIKEISMLYVSLASVNMDMKNYSIALDYAKKALMLKMKLANKLEISNVLSITGQIYMKIDSLDKAEKFISKALNIRQQINNNRRIAGSYYDLAIIYNKKNEPRNAVINLDNALKIFRELDEKSGEVVCLLELSKSYQMLNIMDKSKKCIQEAMDAALLIKNKRLIKNCHKQYANFFYGTNDYKNAYDHYNKYTFLKDSLENVDKTKIFANLELKYQSEKKDSEIKLLKSKTELQRKNNIILILSMILLMISTVLLFILYKNKTQKLKIKTELLKKEKIIHKQDLEIKDHETQLLKKELESKNRELTSKVLSTLKTNKMLESILQKLSILNKKLSETKGASKELNSIIREIENHSGNVLWEDFDKAFQGVHSDFYDKLLKINPDLTASEIKMASLLKLNLNTKEIAAITFKSESSIKSTRFRLRKKLGLDSDKGLVSFLMKL